MRYYFDLSTSARWDGPPVGILRVERELAKRGARLLEKDLGYCAYDIQRNQFLEISPPLARQIMEGTLTLQFERPWKQGGTNIKGKLVQRGRRAMLMAPPLYQAIQRVKGRNFSIAEIRKLRQSAQKQSPTAHLWDVAQQAVPLTESTTIISGGLDWDHKRLRAIWSLKQQSKFSYCAIVYDLIAISFPHFVVPGYVELLREYFGELLWLADKVMCISEATRRDFLAFCETSGLPAPEAYVFPLGCDLAASEDGEPMADLPASLKDKRFALFVSTIEPRKNHRVIYEAWDHAMRAGRLDPHRHRMVFVGRPGWVCNDLLGELARNPVTKSSIVVLHDASDGLLRTLYRHCAFTVFPSHYEGYGLPLAEALLHGRPCLSSAAGSLAEIGGDLVMRLESKDTMGWADAIVKHMTSPDVTESWAERIRARHRPTTWDDGAAIFFDALRLGEARA